MDLPPGIFETPTGFRAYKRLEGVLKSQRFHLKKYKSREAALREAQLWQMTAILTAAGRISPHTPEAGKTFADDARRYLVLVQTMKTFRWRSDDIAQWVRVFGARARSDITAPDVRAQLERWRSVGPKRVWDTERKQWRDTKAPLSASSVNHRRTALMHLYTVLDGKSAPNPAKDAPRYQEPDPEPRAPSRATIDAILKAMPAGRYRAIFGVLAWTGWPHEQIRQLQAEDIDWKAKTAYIRRRGKGKTAKPRTLPLLPQAVKALKEFDALDCWGWRFSASNLRREVLEAIDAAQVPTIRPYDARHFFGTLIAAISQDNTAVRELLLHADDRQQVRYTLAAADPRVAAAVTRVAQSLRK